MDDLGTVLALLHDAPSRVHRLRAEIVSRVDTERTHEAFRRGTEGRGATVYAYAEDDDEEPEPPQVESRARIWADRENRLERAEREGRRSELAVRDGATWWLWDPDNGAVSNGGRENSTTQVAEELTWMLGGIRLAGLLRIIGIERAELAGRAVWRCRAVPRADGERDRFDLHRLPGYGADEYELDVDTELGVIVRVVALLDGEVFSEAEVIELAAGEDFPDELFRFESPDGSPVLSTEESHPQHHMNVSPRRLLDLAGFPLFVPRRVPAEWDAVLGFHETIAMIHLHARDGLRSVQINEHDVEENEDVGWDHANPAPWQTETHGGIDYEWREPNEEWQPARVRFVRDGTRVLIDSASLTAEELLGLARTMVPLRDDAPDFGGSDEPADER